LKDIDDGKEFLNVDEFILMNIFHDNFPTKKEKKEEIFGNEKYYKKIDEKMPDQYRYEKELYNQRVENHDYKIKDVFYNYDHNNNIYMNCLPQLVRELYIPLGVSWDNTALMGTLFNVDYTEKAEKMKTVSVVVDKSAFLSNIFHKRLNEPNTYLSILPTYYKKDKIQYVYLKPIIYENECEFSQIIDNETLDYTLVDDLMRINENEFIPTIDSCWNIGHRENDTSKIIDNCTKTDYMLAKGLKTKETKKIVEKNSSDLYEESLKIQNKMPILKFYFNR